MKGIGVGLSISLLLLAGCTTEMQRADQAYADHDYKTAAADYQDLAASGDPAAERKLAYMYYGGRGVEASDAEAQRWYEKAAMDGDTTSIYNLAAHYLPPNTDPPDYAQAFKWLKVGADHHDVYCELQVSIDYENGIGVARDHDEALHWLNMFIGRTNVAGAPIQYKYKGGDNIGGFMIAMQWALLYSPHYKDMARYAHDGVAQLSFDYQDGRALNAKVEQSSGDPEADAAAVALLQETPLPPVLASIQDIKHFVIGFYFGEATPGVAQSQ